MKSENVIMVNTPISDEVINSLKIGDKISLSGAMYCGRDAVLPKLVDSIENGDADSTLREWL